MRECCRCGFNDEDYGCTCPHSDKWYACPIENKKPENIQALKEYAEWVNFADDLIPIIDDAESEDKG